MPEWVLLAVAGVCGLGAAVLYVRGMRDAYRARRAVRQVMGPWWPYDGGQGSR